MGLTVEADHLIFRTPKTLAPCRLQKVPSSRGALSTSSHTIMPFADSIGSSVVQKTNAPSGVLS
jgi:hypothetical protein